MAHRTIVQSYTHVQATESATWNIRHGLNCYPVVDVVITLDGANEVLLPKDVVHSDKNNTVLTFDTPISGIARCS